MGHVIRSPEPWRRRVMRTWYGLLNRLMDGEGRYPGNVDAGVPTLRSKVMLVVLSTTCLALLLSATALLVYELRAYRQSRLHDLQTQADIIARASTAALSFKDANAAAENLHMLRLRPQITAAAIYLPNGQPFASFQQPAHADAEVPLHGREPGYLTSGDKLELYHPIDHNGERLGVLYLRTDNDMLDRLSDYLMILVGVMVASTAVAALVTARLQRTVTEPILEVAQVARDVMTRRDFSLRARRTSSDEVGLLVDAFNDMLAEVAATTTALEESNRHLSIEMAERRKAEEALKEAARKKDEFLATLAHELRNPLAPISNATEILRRVGNENAPLRQRALDIMARQMRQMVRLIDDLLDVSRITTGKLLLHKERVDLVRILHNAVEIASPMLESRRHTLDVDLPRTPVWIQADATRMGQVFANLLNNAAKYTPEGGQVSLRLQCRGDDALVCVQDNGIGISRDMQGAVFEMFVQVDQSLERGRAGLGVGLTLARQLTALHGGEISVHSEGENKGSSFLVRLPLSTQQGEPTDRRDTAGATDQAGPHLKVLVADDNVDFAVSLGHILESLGHTVSVVHDGRQAVDMALSFRPDIVFLDIGMPGFNGHEVAAHLRRNETTRHAMLVAVSGWSQDKDRERSKAAGITHHLAKPVELAQLLPIIQESQATIEKVGAA